MPDRTQAMIALIEAPGHVCARYRVDPFVEKLRTRGWQVKIEPIAKAVGARINQFRRTRHFDCVLLQRKLLPTWQLRILRGYCRRLVFDFDDAVMYRDSYDRRGPHCPRRARRFSSLVKAADLLLAGNAFLAETAQRFAARAEQITIFPTCIDLDRYPTLPDRSRSIVGQRQPRLVWVGSSSTWQGIAREQEIWNALATAQPELRLRCLSDRSSSLGRLPVEHVQWSETTEVAELQRAHIGISHVPDDLWSRGKCGLKLLQYHAAGIPAVTNPVGVHREILWPGRQGYLVENTSEWVEAISSLIANPEARWKMGLAGRRTVQLRYSTQVWASRFVAAIEGSQPTTETRLSLKMPRRDVEVESRSGQESVGRVNHLVWGEAI